MNRLVFATPCLALLALTGCSQAPVKEIDAAKASLEAARQAQAPDYAPDAWNTATGTEAALEAELKAQEQKVALFRSYDRVTALAAELDRAGQAASQEAVAKKESMKTEVAALLDRAAAEIASAQKAVAEAPRGKGTEADLAGLRTDAASLDAQLKEARTAFDAGDFVSAKAKADAVIDAATRMRDEIERARAARRVS
ncbi:MAG TPA: hypothetical protein VF139_18240 [Candidatus Polarisedimenticolaceae bacterium]